jgi:cytidylate kinase
VHTAFFRAIAHEVFSGGGASVCDPHVNARQARVDACVAGDGAANVVARVRAGVGDVVVKVRVDDDDDGDREVAALRRLGGRAGPQLRAAFSRRSLHQLRAAAAVRGDFTHLMDLEGGGGGVIVMDAVAGAIVDGDPADVDDDVVVATAHAIAELHLCPVKLAGLPPLSSGSSVLALVGGANDLVDGVVAAGLGDDASRRVLRRALRAATAYAEARHPGTRVRSLCHGDLRFFNVMMDRGAASLIDFEFAGVGDPAADVAMMAVRTPLSDHHELVLLDTITRRMGRGTRDFIARYFAVKPLCALVGALGGLLDLAAVARGQRPIRGGHDRPADLAARRVYLRHRGPPLRHELKEALERCAAMTLTTTTAKRTTTTAKKTTTTTTKATTHPMAKAAACLTPTTPSVRPRVGGRCGRVAIDGTAASGKSVIARAVAAHFGVPHYNTGAAYRAFALLALRDGRAWTSPRDVAVAVRAFERAGVVLSGDGAVVVDGAVIDDALTVIEVDEVVSGWAALPAVRRSVNGALAPALRARHAVVEGRDVTSRLWPGAPSRFFLTASLTERTRRVVERLGRKVPVREVRALLAWRDHRDQTRAVDPMICGEGVTHLDTTTSSQDDVVAAVLGRVTAGA